MNNSIGVVVLAAGLSERMNVPKPLLELDGKTLIEHISSNPFLSKKNIHPVTVLGYKKDLILSKVQLSIPHVYNKKYKTGRTASVQCGIRALPKDVNGVFIWPVDCPLVPSYVFDLLANSFVDPSTICIPSFKRHRGHPPLIGCSFFKEILAMAADQSLKDLYQIYTDSIKNVTVDTETVLQNINTPDDYEIMKKSYKQLTKSA